MRPTQYGNRFRNRKSRRFYPDDSRFICAPKSCIDVVFILKVIVASSTPKTVVLSRARKMRPQMRLQFESKVAGSIPTTIHFLSRTQKWHLECVIVLKK